MCHDKLGPCSEKYRVTRISKIYWHVVSLLSGSYYEYILLPLTLKISTHSIFLAKGGKSSINEKLVDFNSFNLNEKKNVSSLKQHHPTASGRCFVLICEEHLPGCHFSGC